jgi:hypothetical protein
MTVPPSRCAEMLHDMKHDPLEEAYARAYASVKQEEHNREVRTSTIGLLMRLFVQAALIANRDDIYLFAGYRMD